MAVQTKRFGKWIETQEYVFFIFYKVLAWVSYLVMYLLLTECHQND